ncbi:MAG: ubiquinone/menaquinone biosynthesis methyltransferase [Chloroflexi bacterium]|nr:ubiquinone/menaquinone biosynthesis methyltransferase [Chloroflexota bacterium]
MDQPTEAEVAGAVPGADKGQQVRRMFSAIHAHYDRMNRLMSLGRDRAWRRVALAEAALPPQGLLLDVATGSGDVLLEAAQQHPGVQAVGVDFTPEMLDHAQERLGAAGLSGRAQLALADALALPFPAGRFDAAMSAFMMRNVADVAQAFAEQRRVVRPGGRVVCLELTWPRAPVFGRLFSFYFRRLVPLVGGWLSGDLQAYRYLPQSVAQFYTPQQVQALMEGAGFRGVRYRKLMLGTVTVHVGVRPGEGEPLSA